MKKTLIILALAFAMVAVASVAYAVNPADADAASHGGYATTTNACVQCHDVHGAETFVDAPLWRWANAAAGCAYCHGDGAGAGGASAVDVYTGLGTAEAQHTIGAAVVFDSTAAGQAQITDGGVDALDCFDCHNGGVHGAGGGFYALTNDATANAFCGRCHDLNLTNGVVDGTSHALVAEDNVHAFAGSPNCISCHDDDSAVVDFPHATPNYVFAGPDSDVATLDAVCLACHVDNIATPTAGVGVTY